ncbi:hypothetical protein, partial [Cronobacter sakazakii]
MNARYGLRKSGIALLLCVLLLPLARLLSPKAIVDGAGIYLTFLPLSLMLAMIYLFGRYALFGNDSNLLIVFYVQIMPDDFV